MDAQNFNLFLNSAKMEISNRLKFTGSEQLPLPPPFTTPVSLIILFAFGYH